MQIAKTLIAMRGYPGTGKSTLARALGKALHIPILDRDVIRQIAVDSFGDLSAIGRFSYELLFALAREQLRLGLSVIIDTPLTYHITYEQARSLAQDFHIPLLVIHCHCSPELQRNRLEGRKGNVSAFQITSWEEWERWRPLFESFEDHGCSVDTAQQLESSLASVVQCLQEFHKPTSPS